MPTAPSNPSSELIAALRHPGCYPHPVSDIQVIETHISWVILTGEFAYKIKKPIDLGFLDFSTLERRRFFCAEELRLNRRLAPALYLDVVAIGGDPQHPEMGGTGAALEYAVRMRQFPQDCMLDAVIERGRLSVPMIAELAADIARFHQAVPQAAADAPFGTPQAVLAPVRENFAQIGPQLTDPRERERLLALERWCGEEFERCCEAFARRRHEGFVRECHGDLHLGNMALLDGRITVFDCIEFNENLYWIDAFSDVAFLVMDLQRRGLAEHAGAFLNGYLEHTGDYGGLALLRFYGVYRALVRAKVACIRAAQPGLGAGEVLAQQREYRQFITTAETLAAPQRPYLLITHGVSGSGKTTISSQLLGRLGAVRIRSDVERKRLFGLAATQRGEDIYGTDATAATYARLQELSETVLGAGLPVIVDATFLDRRMRDAFRALAQRRGLPLLILHCEASPEALRDNIRRRRREARDASDADLRVLERQLAAYVGLDEDECSQTVSVRADRPIDAELICREVLRLVERGGADARG